MKQRMLISSSAGAVLGIFCILGVGYRLGFAGNELYLFATWFNRVVLGITIGLASSLRLTKGSYNPYFRGLFFGLLISFSFYVATDFRDMTGFLAGIVYGVIIDGIATKYAKEI